MHAQGQHDQHADVGQRGQCGVEGRPHPAGHETLHSTTLGWRVAYLVGPVLALVIIFVRRHLPESPRWQIMHGRAKAAEASIKEIEDDVAATKGEIPPVDSNREIVIRPTEQIGYVALLRSLFKHYPSRSIYGGTLMITQSFLYNAIFFTYGLVLLYFFHVPSKDTPYYFMAFCAGNLLGPLTIGHLFDVIGRRKMIAGTYLLSGLLLAEAMQCASDQPETIQKARPLTQGAGHKVKDQGKRDVTLRTTCGAIVVRVAYFSRNCDRDRSGKGMYPILLLWGMHDRCTSGVASEVSKLVAMLGSLEEVERVLADRGQPLDLKTIRSMAYRFAARARAAQRTGSLNWGETVAGRRVIVSVDGGRIRIRTTKEARRNNLSCDGSETPDFPGAQGRQLDRLFWRAS